MSDLIALAEGRVMGTVTRIRGRLRFAYAEEWRAYPAAYPLSLSMPLAAQEHVHGVTDAYLWGLLPDNELVLTRWAQRFHVSARNNFALLEHVGEDCAGAVQFVAPHRVEALLTGANPDPQWLTDAEVGERLRLLRSDAATTRLDRDTGQFSLAGAQPKIALLQSGGRWAVPAGRTPTTHILKPTLPDLDGHAENEHLCLNLARAVGLPAAQSSVLRLDDVTAIVVTRYDRVPMHALAAAAAARAAAAAAEAAATKDPVAATEAAGRAAAGAAEAEVLSGVAATTPIYRAHQEDFCQALAVHPLRKYQSEGGPGVAEALDLLRAHASGGVGRGRPSRNEAARQDREIFAGALLFNWLVGGTDAHAKNFSLLIGGGGLVRLAPLYDIASVFGHPHLDPRRAKLAMKIGGEYRLEAIGVPEWRRFAQDSGLDPDHVVEQLRRMAVTLGSALPDLVAQQQKEGAGHPCLPLILRAVTERARRASRL